MCFFSFLFFSFQQATVSLSLAKYRTVHIMDLDILRLREWQTSIKIKCCLEQQRTNISFSMMNTIVGWNTAPFASPAVLTQPPKPLLLTAAVGKSILIPARWWGQSLWKRLLTGRAHLHTFSLHYQPAWSSISLAIATYLHEELNTARAPRGHRVKGSSLGGRGLPCWKNTVAGLLDVL